METAPPPKLGLLFLQQPVEASVKTTTKKLRKVTVEVEVPSLGPVSNEKAKPSPQLVAATGKTAKRDRSAATTAPTEEVVAPAEGKVPKKSKASKAAVVEPEIVKAGGPIALSDKVVNPKRAEAGSKAKASKKEAVTVIELDDDNDPEPVGVKKKKRGRE